MLSDLFLQLGALAGFGALVGLIVNIGKAAKIVKDGQAQTWSAGLNLLGLATLFALKVFAPQVDVAGLDAVAAQVAQIGLLIFGLVVQLTAARATHALVRGMPLLGKSFTR